jgi:hypothetical protein
MKGVASGQINEFFAQRAQTKAKAAVEEGKEEEELRKQALATLSQAALNGKLQAVLESRAQQKMAQETTDLRQRLRKSLVQGASSGKLEEVLNSVQEAAQKKTEKASKEYLREQALVTLTNAARSGALSTVLETVKAKRSGVASQEVSDEASQKSISLLKEKLFAKRQEIKYETLLSKACVALEEALDSGEPQEEEADAGDLNQLKLQVRNTLLRAAREGTLTSTLEAFAAKKQVSASVAEGEVKLQSPSAVTLEKLPLAATDVVAAASPSSSRSRRRIIGGVSRIPSSTQQQFQEWDLGSTSLMFKPMRSNGGAMQRVEMAVAESRGAPAFDRPKSRNKSRLPASSALAMDLGLSEDAPSTNSPITVSTLRESLSLMRPSASTGALPTMNWKQSSKGLLPTLAVNKKCPETIAQTMRMSKSTSRLQGVSSMVF